MRVYFGGGSSPRPPAPLPEPITSQDELTAAARAEALRRSQRRGRGSLVIQPTGVVPMPGDGGGDYPPMP